MSARVWVSVFVCVVLLNSFGLPAEAGDAELLARYRGFWKAEFLKRNGFDEAEFAAQIKIRSEEIMRGAHGAYYRIDFTHAWSWLEIRDFSLVQIRESGANAPWFDEQQFARAIAARRGNTEMHDLQPGRPLAFASLEEAKAAITKKTGIIEFVNAEVSYYVPGRLPRSDGDPHLIFSGYKGATAAPERIRPSGTEFNGNTGVVPPHLEKPTPRPQQEEIRHYERAPDPENTPRQRIKRHGNTGVVPPHLRQSAPAPAPQLDSQEIVAPDRDQEDDPGGPILPVKLIPPPSERAEPVKDAPARPGLVPARVRPSGSGIRGWLNLVTGAMHSHEDALIHY